MIFHDVSNGGITSLSLRVMNFLVLGVGGEHYDSGKLDLTQSPNVQCTFNYMFLQC